MANIPTIYDIKPAFQNLLRPITRALAKQGITANQVTLLACGLSFLTGALIFVQLYASQSAALSGLNNTYSPRIFLLVPLIMFIRMALNAIDGMLAREHNMKTPLGAILNELTDVLSDSALYLPFALIPGASSIPVVLIVIFSIVSEMTGVLGIMIGASRRYDGPMGKSDRAFVFAVVSIVLGLGATADPWLNIVFWIVFCLLVATVMNRAHRALSEIQ